MRTVQYPFLELAQLVFVILFTQVDLTVKEWKQEITLTKVILGVITLVRTLDGGWGINRKLTMMRLLTKLGAQTLHAIMKLADHRISITMPTIGNVQGGQNYDSIIRRKEKNKPIM